MLKSHSFIKNKKYYSGEVYEFNLPTGTTCPFALECKVVVDRITGKFDVKKGAYRCYASSSERFPGVREHRWRNFDYVKSGGIPILPDDCKAVRIHASGDFFNQAYFDTWMKLAQDNPGIEFWAYTKSIQYWINRIPYIPKNFILTASYGGRQDHLIQEYNLKNVIIYPCQEEVPSNRPVDFNDDYARIPEINFALLDNLKNKKIIKK
ncbi:Gene 88 protein [uncultured Caudovirales phage]|uniref:Gene 88 protein n=1 Tax=uncultured Caudovirales phage TaxID=2100421 RepID=A0A6J7X923_9CAUD|nr:Gene 88 protein [uncultured Caudovirales phage]